MAEKAEAMIIARSTASTPVQNRLTCGRSSAKGSAPRIENHMTGMRPTRSPTAPPARVPSTMPPRKGNRQRGAAVAGQDAAKEGEQVELRWRDGRVELLDQVERVVRAEAGAVDVLGEEQGHQD